MPRSTSPRPIHIHLVRGEYKLTLPFAEQMEMIGRARNDAVALFSGLSNHGYTRFLLGEITLARTLLERCLGLDLANLAARSGIGAFLVPRT